MGGNYIQGADGKMEGSTPSSTKESGGGHVAKANASVKSAMAVVFNVNPKTGPTAEQKALAASIMFGSRGRK